MKICLYISLFMLQFTAGCHLSEDEHSVTGYTGGSVLLSCVCADPQSKVKTFTWSYFDSPFQNEIFQNVKFSGRLKLFNETSPTNLSLLISDLKKEDEGLYRCEIPFSHYRDISLKIKDCELLNNTYITEVKARAGESVVLPCYCNDLQTKPEQHTWTYLNKTSTIIYSTVKSQRRNLVKLLKENFSVNLSLIISDLTHEHQGIYRCTVGSQYVDIKLIVEEKRHHTTPHATSELTNQVYKSTTTQLLEDKSTNPYIVPVISLFSLLLLTVAVMFWRCRAGRNVTNDRRVLRNDEATQGVLMSFSTQEQNIKHHPTEDEVTYSAIVHKTAVKAAHRQIVTAELSDYATLK